MRKGKFMAVYKFEYVETNRAYFGVEASSKEEAYERFEKWLDNSDHVSDAVRKCYHLDTDWSINDNAYIGNGDILTEEMYKAL